jgi:DNA-damage-inducible protein J
MGQININIRMDENLKRQFEAFCIDVGLNMTAAFNVFAKAVVRQKRIPFEISTENDPFYSKSNLEVLRQSIKELDEGKYTIHDLIEE